MPKLTSCLWFDDNAEEAARFYASIFPNSKVGAITRYGEASAKAAGRPVGSTPTVAFELDGEPFMAVNGGPIFKLSEAVSFMIDCETQEEIDRYWAKLTADGGEESYCAWLKDKFGLSWQVVPSSMEEIMKDPAKAERAMEAVLTMRKLDIRKIEEACGY